MSYSISKQRQHDRLKAALQWFPLPCFVSFLLFILLTEFVSLSLNPRLGNQANVLTIPSKENKGGGIWLAVSMREGRVLITTDNRDNFTHGLPPKPEELEPIRSFFSSRQFEDTLTAGMSIAVRNYQSRVVLATDQWLQYKHIQPLLTLIAEAGITQVHFETKLPADISAKPEASDQPSTQAG